MTCPNKPRRVKSAVRAGPVERPSRSPSRTKIEI